MLNIDREGTVTLGEFDKKKKVSLAQFINEVKPEAIFDVSDLGGMLRLLNMFDEYSEHDLDTEIVTIRARSPQAIQVDMDLIRLGVARPKLEDIYLTVIDEEYRKEHSRVPTFEEINGPPDYDCLDSKYG